MKTTCHACTIALLTALPFAVPPTAATAQSDAQATKAFEAADQNGDQTLNKAEFRRFIKSIAALGHAEAQRAVKFGNVGYGIAWRQADQDKSGSVTLAELAVIR